jgi:hypothetical protein
MGSREMPALSPMRVVSAPAGSAAKIASGVVRAPNSVSDEEEEEEAVEEA